MVELLTGLLLGQGIKWAASKAVEKIAEDAIGGIRNSLWKHTANKLRPQFEGRFRRPKRPPVNHDLIKAVRRSWLNAISMLAGDLQKFSDRNDANGENLQVYNQLAMRSRREVVTWGFDRQIVTWDGVSIDAIARLYDAAGQEAGSLQIEVVQVEGDISLIDLAVHDIAILLDLNTPNLIPPPIIKSLHHGWSGENQLQRNFLDTVKDFMLTELKTDERARTSYGFRLANAALEELRDIDTNLMQVSEAQALASIQIEKGFETLEKQLISLNEMFEGQFDEIKGAIEQEAKNADIHRKFTESSLSDTREHNRSVDKKLELIRHSIDERETALDADIGDTLRLTEEMTSEAIEDRSLAAGSSPSWRNARKSLFLTRQTLLDTVVDEVKRWRSASPHLGLKVPVFWIDGRSGDGKSTLLLQLAEAQLLQAAPQTFFSLVKPDKLPSWLRWASANTRLGEMPVAVIDDLANIENEILFSRGVREALGVKSFPAFILTCGTTSQLASFSTRFESYFDLHSWTIPEPSQSDQKALAAWLGLETQIGDGAQAGPNAPRFVETAFSLTRGSPDTFAENFWGRARQLGIDRCMRAMLALNAVDLPASLDLAAVDEERDAISTFVREEKYQPVGSANSPAPTNARYRLYHGRLSWLILSASAPPNVSLARYWAQCLVPAIEAAQAQRDPTLITPVLRAMASSMRLSEGRTPRNTVGDFSQIVAEFLDERSNSSRYWPFITAAINFLSDDELGRERGLVRDRTEHLLVAPHHDPDLKAYVAVAELLRIGASPDKRNRQLASRALQSVEVAKVAPIAAVRLLNSNFSSDDAEDILRAIAEASCDEEYAGVFLLQLIARKSSGSWSTEVAVRWLDVWPTLPVAASIIQSLIKRAPTTVLLERAIIWLDTNPADVRASNLLLQLLSLAAKQSPGSAGLEASNLIARSLEWMALNINNAGRPQLLARLLALFPKDDTITSAAFNMLPAVSKYGNGHNLIEAALNHPRTRAVARLAAADWLAENTDHARSNDLFDRLLSVGQPADLITVFNRWILLSTKAKQNLALLIRLLETDFAEKLYHDLGARWIKANPSDPGAPLLLEMLASIPSATSLATALLSECVSHLRDPVDKRDLIWLFVRNDRLARGGTKQLAQVIACEAAEDDLPFLTHQFILRSQASGGAAILLAQLFQFWPDWDELPFLVFDVLRSSPNNSRFAEAVANWLPHLGARPGALQVAVCLSQHAATNAKRLSSRKDIESDDGVAQPNTANFHAVAERWRVVYDRIWDWLDAVAGETFAPSLAANLISDAHRFVEDAFSRGIRWVCESCPSRSDKVWEALFEKARRLADDPSDPLKLRRRLLEQLEDAVEDWLKIHSDHPSAPSALSLAISIDPLCHIGSNAQSISTKDDKWKASLLSGWLKRSPNHSRTNFVVRHALQVPEIRKRILPNIRAWINSDQTISANENLIEYFVDLASSLKGSAHASVSVGLRAAAVEWVSRDAGHPGVAHILNMLLCTASGEDHLLQFARDWLGEHQSHPGYSLVLTSYMKTSEDDRLLDAARDWVAQHSEAAGASYVVLAILDVSSTASDNELAHSWVEKRALASTTSPHVMSVLTRRGLIDMPLCLRCLEAHFDEAKPSRVGSLLSALARTFENANASGLSVLNKKGDHNDIDADLGAFFRDDNVQLWRIVDSYCALSNWSTDQKLVCLSVDLLLMRNYCGVAGTATQQLQDLLGRAAGSHMSGAWFQSKIERGVYIEVLYPYIISWILSNFATGGASFVVKALLDNGYADNQLLEALEKCIDSFPDARGVPFVMSALIQNGPGENAVRICEKWLRSSTSLDGASFVLQDIVASLDEGMNARSIVCNALMHYSLDQGSLSVFLMFLARYGWDKDAAQIADRLRHMISRELISISVLKIKNIQSSSMAGKRAVLHYVLAAGDGPVSEHAVNRIIEWFIEDIASLLDELNAISRPQLILQFFIPIIDIAETDAYCMKQLLLWVGKGRGRIWRRILRPHILAVAVRVVEYRDFLVEIFSETADLQAARRLASRLVGENRPTPVVQKAFHNMRKRHKDPEIERCYVAVFGSDLAAENARSHHENELDDRSKRAALNSSGKLITKGIGAVRNLVERMTARKEG